MKKPLALACASLLLAACGGGGGSDSGTLNLSVTDAPVDNADAVFVTFTGVELRSGGDAPIVITFDEPIGLDLLQLQGDQSAFLIQGQELPAGVYDEVRLRVAGEANSACNAGNGPYDSYITINGNDEPLIVPSGATSGYKVKGGITIAAGQRGDYTVDFDLRKSIAERGSTGCYNLKPVLRVVDNAVTGTLTGNVDPALLADVSCASVSEGDVATGAGSAVYVYEGNVTPDDFDGLTDDVNGPDPLTTAMLVPPAEVGGDFTYKVGFLLTGEYTVAFTCQAGNDVPPETIPPPEMEEVESDNPLLFVQPQVLTIEETAPDIADDVNPNRVDFTVVTPVVEEPTPVE